MATDSVSNAIIGGVRLYTTRAPTAEGFDTKLFLAKCETAPVMVSGTPQELARWTEDVADELERMKQALRDHVRSRQIDAANTSWGHSAALLAMYELFDL